MGPDGQPVPTDLPVVESGAVDLGPEGRVWLERPGQPGLLDDLVLERFAMSARVLTCSQRRTLAPDLADPALVELVLAEREAAEDRARARIHCYQRLEILSAALLDDVEKEYRVDKDRIYVTGLSMGGYGTFDLAMKYPNRFAAIIPICGGADTKYAQKIKHLPTWVFHGEQDFIVPITSSEKIVQALEKCQADVKFTAYPEADHDSWTDTYNNIEVYKWLLGHKSL